MIDIIRNNGFGVISKAYHRKLENYVSLKSFNLHLHSSEAFDQVKLEDALLSKIQQINVNNSSFFPHYYGVYQGNVNETLLLQYESGLATLDDILRAGKVYDCDELLYVLKRLVTGLAILQDNGIANRDIKTSNIILIEDSENQGNYIYKLSDFGSGCQLDKDCQFLDISYLPLISQDFSAPELSTLTDIEAKHYNPFVADVYSLGIVILKMIDYFLGKKDVDGGSLFSDTKTFEGYQRILVLLEKMLQEDPKKRVDFKLLNNEINETLQDIEAIPHDISKYYNIWIDQKEKNKAKTVKGLQNLYKEHKELYISYSRKEAKTEKSLYHLEKAWVYFQELKKKTVELINPSHNEIKTPKSPKKK